jgi:geranylgeranyl diphosphate synthase type I
MNETTKQEENTAYLVQQLLNERGKKGLEMARKKFLEEDIESTKVREAMEYFMIKYWHDVARPALLSLVCEAVGGDPDTTIPIAIPLSLISGAIDIHDDIIDQSDVKGSRPTVLGKFGKEIALLVGDALFFKGFTLLHEAVKIGIPAEKVTVISDIIKRTFFELGDAEALELQFRRRIDVTPEQYLRVVKKKAADVEAHTRIGAILGNGTGEEVEALSDYGRLLGILIILRDDMIDMIDNEEVVHRIKKEHLSLPIIYALQNPESKTILTPIIEKKKITTKDLEKIITTVMKANGFAFVDKVMQRTALEAVAKIEKVKTNNNYLIVLVNAMLSLNWKNFLNATKYV